MCFSPWVFFNANVCACLWTVYKCLQNSLHSLIVFLVAVHSVQLLLFVREAHEPHSSFCGTAASSWIRDGITDTGIRQPAGIAAVVLIQLPGSKHLANLSNLSTILLTSPHGFIIGQLRGVVKIVEFTWRDKTYNSITASIFNQNINISLSEWSRR